MKGAEMSSLNRRRPAPTPQDVCPLLMGSRVPAITLTTLEGQPLDLEAASRARPTVIVFYRGGW